MNFFKNLRIYSEYLSFNPLSAKQIDEFSIFGLNASVDIRPLPGAWVAELLGVILRVQNRLKVKFPIKNIYTYGT